MPESLKQVNSDTLGWSRLKNKGFRDHIHSVALHFHATSLPYFF